MVITLSSSALESRAQASPTAALVAVAMVGIALSLYATVFAGVVPTAERELAEPTLSRVHDTVAPAGVLEPASLDAGLNVGPTGRELRIELRTDERLWSVGAPLSNVCAQTETASRQVPVRMAPGRVRVGWLRVVIQE